MTLTPTPTPTPTPTLTLTPTCCSRRLSRRGLRAVAPRSRPRAPTHAPTRARTRSSPTSPTPAGACHRTAPKCAGPLEGMKRLGPPGGGRGGEGGCHCPGCSRQPPFNEAALPSEPPTSPPYLWRSYGAASRCRAAPTPSARGAACTRWTPTAASATPSRPTATAM